MRKQTSFALLWLSLTGLFVAGCLALPKMDALIYGAWRTADPADAVVMTFAPDNTFTLARADGQGETLAGHYRFDMSVQPFHLDLDLGDMGQIATIMEFVDSDTIRIQDTSPGAPRAADFDDATSVFMRESAADAATTADIPQGDGDAQPTETNRAMPLQALLRFVPDTPEHRRYLTYGDYAAWLEAWEITRPADIDAVNSMADEDRNRWISTMARQTEPPRALALQYAMAEPMAEHFGFDFFGSNQYLETGAPPDVLTVLTHQVDEEALKRALTAVEYDAQDLNDDGTLYSRGEDNAIDPESETVAGRMGELNRIVHQGDTLVIGRNTDAVATALATAAGQAPSLLDLPAYETLLTSLDAPELIDMGALVGLVIMAEPILADVADLLFSDNTPEEIMAQWEEMTTQEPPLSPYLVAGFATYRAPDTTYLALHTVFPDEEAAVQGTEILADRMQKYVSVVTGAPLPWMLEHAFSTDTTSVVVMRLEQQEETARAPAWLEMLIRRDTLFLLTE